VIDGTAINQLYFSFMVYTYDHNIDVKDKRILKAVGRVVTAAVYRQNNGTL